MKLTKTAITTKQAADLLIGKKRVAIFSHINPDGDTVGASVALKLMLNKAGVSADLYCESDMNAKLLCFDEVGSYRKICSDRYDLLVAVDCGDIFRLGENSGYYASFAETMTIDHHGGEFFSKYNCLKEYSSTCQIVYEISRDMDVKLDGRIATYLYMGLCTDTGNFAHSNTDSASFYFAGDLFGYNADIEKVYKTFFRDITYAETMLRAKVVARMRSYYDGEMYLIYITQNDLAEFGLDHSVTTGIVGYAIDIDTARAGVCITEFAPNTYKVSMRGKDFNVREVCKEFGGGGHVLASGCRIDGFLEDVIEKIVRAVGYTI